MRRGRMGEEQQQGARHEGLTEQQRLLLPPRCHDNRLLCCSRLFCFADKERMLGLVACVGTMHGIHQVVHEVLQEPPCRFLYVYPSSCRADVWVRCKLPCALRSPPGLGSRLAPGQLRCARWYRG